MRRSAVSTAYSSKGFGFHSSPVVSIFAPPAGILTLLALSGSATRLSGTRIFTCGTSEIAFRRARPTAAESKLRRRDLEAFYRPERPPIDRQAGPRLRQSARSCASDGDCHWRQGRVLSARAPDASRCDFLVIGSGIAGLTFALEAAEHGDVVIVTKRARDESNTSYAQGGIAAVLGPDDSFEAHVARHAASPAPASATTSWSRSACARARRASRAASSSARSSRARARRDRRRARSRARGRAQRAARRARRRHHRARGRARAARGRRATTRTSACSSEHMAIDLITLAQVRRPAIDASAPTCSTTRTAPGRDDRSRARRVLATGGAGKVYLYTTNPDVATGDGVAMAYRAGAEIANMEFFQFHPTCLYHPQAKSFLISEALRGEGGDAARCPTATPFMERHHPLRRPRAARRRGARHRLRDEAHRRRVRAPRHHATSRPTFVRERFPNIYAECLRFGIDITAQPIPVVPAAHYMCGGVITDLHGRTTLPGPVGDRRDAPAPACTAPTAWRRTRCSRAWCSAHRAADALGAQIAELRAAPLPDVPEWQTRRRRAERRGRRRHATTGTSSAAACGTTSASCAPTSACARAARRIALLEEEIREYYWKHLVTRDLLELRNIADVAELIVACASSAARAAACTTPSTTPRPTRAKRATRS